MADQLHLVPIRIDALYLDRDTLMAEPSVDFARLPFFNGQRDVNPDVANISENFVAPPLQNQNQLYPQGLHLHWALPDALTRGRRVSGDERSTLEFPAVPDRWLVQRSGGNLAERRWVVESNFLWPEEERLQQLIEVEQLISRYQESTMLVLHEQLQQAWGAGRSLVLLADRNDDTLLAGFREMVDELSGLATTAAPDGLPPDENKQPKLLQAVSTEAESFALMRQNLLLLEQSQPEVAALLSGWKDVLDEALNDPAGVDSHITAIRTYLGQLEDPGDDTGELLQLIKEIKQEFTLYKEAELFPLATTLAQLRAELSLVTEHPETLTATLERITELETTLGAAAVTEPTTAAGSTTSVEVIQSQINQYLDLHPASALILQELRAFLELPPSNDSPTEQELQSLHDALAAQNISLALAYAYLPFFQTDLQQQLDQQVIDLHLLQERLALAEAELDNLDGSSGDPGDPDDGGDDDSFSTLIAQKQAELDPKIIERDGAADGSTDGLIEQANTAADALGVAESELTGLQSVLLSLQNENTEAKEQRTNLQGQLPASVTTPPTETEAALQQQLEEAEANLETVSSTLADKEAALTDSIEQVGDLNEILTETTTVRDDISALIKGNIPTANQAPAQDRLNDLEGLLRDLIQKEDELATLEEEYRQSGDPAKQDEIGVKNGEIANTEDDIETEEEALINLAVAPPEGDTTTPEREHIISLLPDWKELTRSIIDHTTEKTAKEGEQTALEDEIGDVGVAGSLKDQESQLQATIVTLNDEILFLQLQASITDLTTRITELEGADGISGLIGAKQTEVDNKETEIEGSADGTIDGLRDVSEDLYEELNILEAEIDNLEREIERLEAQQAQAGSSGSSSAATTLNEQEQEVRREIENIENAIAFQEKTIRLTAGQTFESYADKRKYAISMPVVDAWMTAGAQAYRYMGRSLSLEQYLARPQVGQEYYHPLTALGYGEPSFAAFYPNCRSVFGFHDAEIDADVDQSVNYTVIGWYSELENDYLRQLLAAAELSPLYELAYQARWLHPVTITLTEFTALLPDTAEVQAIWDLLRENAWLEDTGTADEATILIQDGLPEFPEDILTRPALVEEALQDHLAASSLLADFPEEMICAAQLQFEPLVPDNILLKTDLSSRLATMLSDRSDSVPDLDKSVNDIWDDLQLAKWIELVDENNTDEAFILPRKARVPRFLDLPLDEDISQAMVEEALQAEPAVPLSVTVAHTSREAIAARLAHAVTPLDSGTVQELRLLEAEIKDLEVQVDSLLNRQQKFTLTDEEQETLDTLSARLDAKQNERANQEELLANDEQIKHSERLQVEDQLEALFLTDQITDQQLDTGPRFAQTRHEAGFIAQQGGTQWMVRLERAGEQDAQSVTEAERNRLPLPATVATALAMLNDRQEQYDQAHFLIDSRRQQLFSDWYKYMMSTYPPQDSLLDFPDIDEVRYFIQEKDLLPLWDLLTGTGQLLLDDPDKPYAASSELGVNMDAQLSAALQREIEVLDTTPEESLRDFLLDFTDRRDQLSFLLPEEITDWTGLISLLQNPGDSLGTQQVLDSLPADVQVVVRTADAAAPTTEEQNLITQGLVSLLMLSTQTGDVLNFLQDQLRAENISLALLAADDIADWAAFFNALTSPPAGSLLETLRQSLDAGIQEQIDSQHEVRSQLITTYNEILGNKPVAGRLTALLDSLREFGRTELTLLQLVETQIANWNDVFNELKAAGSDEEVALLALLSESMQEAINTQDATSLSSNELARIRVVSGLRKLLWQGSSQQAVHALVLLDRWLEPELILNDLEPSDIRDWPGLLYELKYKQANPEIADLWAALPAELQTQLTENEVEEVLIDEAEKAGIIESINEQLQLLDFRDAAAKAEPTPLEDIVAANRELLEAELGSALRPSLKGSYRLQRQSSPRFWSPQEPSILVTGEPASHSDRFGKDGQAHNGLLECHLLTSAPVADVLTDASQLKALTDAIAALAPPEWRTTTGINPWHPFLLEWEMEACPIQFGGNSRDTDYTAGFIIDNTQLAVNAVDLSTTTDQFLEGNNPNIYNGRNLLSTQAATLRDLESRLQGFLNNAADGTAFKTEAQAALNELGQLKNQMLSQSLSGLHAAMLMLRQSYQLPVMDPIGFREYQDFTYLVSELVGTATKYSPQPLTDFNPIRSGKLRINQVRVVDTFGQYRQLDLYGSRNGAQLLGSSIGTTEVDGLSNRAMIDLTSRIVQPCRLSFRWLAAEQLVEEESVMEMNNLPGTSPICGWVMGNHLDGSIMVFDAAGRSLGAIENENTTDDTLAEWTPAPGLEGLELPENIENEQLRKMVDYFRRQKAEFVEQFLENSHKILQSIEPETFAQQQALALLMGRPLALVRAHIDLELYGVPAVNHSWESFYRDRQDNDDYRETDQYTRVRFPIRLGAVAQLNDGLIGYWVEDELGNYRGDNFYINLMEVDPTTPDPQPWELINPDLHDKFILLDDEQIPITQSLETDEPPVSVSMLLDPRAKVHAFSGILPAKSITIPSEQYLPAMQAIDITFLTAPVLTTAGKIQVPLQDEPGFAWSWLEQLAPDNWREVHTYPTLRKDLFVETFSRQIWGYLLQRKWVADAGGGIFVVNPLDQRNPLSTNFESLKEKLELELPAAGDPVTEDVATPLITNLWDDVLLNVQVGWLRVGTDDEGNALSIAIAELTPMEERSSQELLVLDDDGSTLLHDFRGLETRVEEQLVRLQTAIHSPVTEAQFLSEQLWLREGWLQLKRVE